ncbi:hypothetical protein XocBAI21_14885 [Xanthomonas oryzae pv. oryzicola]|nr:hypothetical protein XocBAI21_14885 [Xanthomonas oryzae pv. oryzicola]
MDMQYRDLDARLMGVGMQRGALFTLLREAWPQHAQLHVDTQITAIDHAGVRVQDQRGHWHGPYDLIIAADGSASTVARADAGNAAGSRVSVGSAVVSVAARRLAVRGRIAPALYRRTQDDRSAAGGHASGRRQPRLSFFWSLPCSDFVAWEQRGIAAWRDEVAQMWPEAHARLATVQVHGALARASYRDAVVSRWHRGRFVLAGDAAHAMSPQLGQGVNMALLDALAMRDARCAARRRRSGRCLAALSTRAPGACGDLSPLEPLADAVVPVRTRSLGPRSRPAAAPDGTRAGRARAHAACA